MTFPTENELRYAGAEIAFAGIQAVADAHLAKYQAELAEQAEQLEHENYLINARLLGVPAEVAERILAMAKTDQGRIACGDEPYAFATQALKLVNLP